MRTKIHKVEDSHGLSMNDEFVPRDKARQMHPRLFEPRPPTSEQQDLTRTRPFFDTVLVSCEASDSECPCRSGLTGILLLLLIESSFAFFAVSPNSAFLTTAPFLCLLGFALFRARRRRTERIVVENGVIRISRYARDRLVEQRRMKLCDLTIELREATNRDCMQIVLRAGDRKRAGTRTIEIARRLAPAERALFLNYFLEGMRRSGANPRIQPARWGPLLARWETSFE
jgi:hypothetical protein